jgi:putative ABC transport system permease protein
MFKNYVQTAYRSLQKNKAYSFLNIFGLAIGIACAGLIFLWVEDEVGFDSNNVNKNSVYLVKVNAQEDAGMFTHSSTPGPLAEVLGRMRGVEATCRTSEGSAPPMFRIGDKTLNAGGLYAEPSIFNLFTLPFVQGNAHNAMTQLYSLVITERTAKKFFGNEQNVVGKTVRMDEKQDYVITGVIKDLPENATLQFEWLAPFELFTQQYKQYKTWNNFGLTTYVKLSPGVDPAVINKPLLDPYYDFTTQRVEKETSTDHVFLFGMKDWRLYNQFENGKPTGGGRIQYVHLFSVIAWIILFIACINFMNLATARSEKRSKEVGVRKVLGAGKNSLIGQFLGEALFMTVLAAIVAVALMSVSLPAFNLLVQKKLTLGAGNLFHWGALIILTLLCGLISGSYPSLYLSAFNPIFVLKGMKVKTGGAAFIRKGLVVLQFTISIVLIISTIIIYQQIRHVKERNLGFNKNNLIQINLQGNMLQHFEAIRQEFISTGLVENAALADHPTLFGGNNTGGMTWAGEAPGANVVISQRVVSEEYLSTLGMKLIEGRDFESTDGVNIKTLRDSASRVLVTASMEKLMGHGSAIGKILTHNSNLGPLRLQIVGVVKDYVYGDMYGHADPVVFYDFPNETSLMYVRLKAGASPELALARMEEIVKKDNPGYPFAYVFVDDQFNNLFASENLISKLSSVFASLAILISCLGLFGLAAYTAERRIKEIGIRKVLGASARSITHLLSKDFLQLVFLSCVIAFPLAGWMMHHWLQGYAYRIGLSAWVFMLAGALSVLIALVTVSFQAIRAALANPVKSLRSE